MTLFKFIENLQKLLSKIPKYVLDIIKKVIYILAGFLLLIVLIKGAQKGARSVSSSGLQIAKDGKDLFYLSRLKEENLKSIEINEDIDIDITFSIPSRLGYRSDKKSKDRLLSQSTRLYRFLEKKKKDTLMDNEIFFRNKVHLDKKIVKEKFEKPQYTDDLLE